MEFKLTLINRNLGVSTTHDFYEATLVIYKDGTLKILDFTDDVPDINDDQILSIQKVHAPVQKDTPTTLDKIIDSFVENCAIHDKDDIKNICKKSLDVYMNPNGRNTINTELYFRIQQLLAQDLDQTESLFYQLKGMLSYRKKLAIQVKNAPIDSEIENMALEGLKWSDNLIKKLLNIPE